MLCHYKGLVWSTARACVMDTSADIVGLCQFLPGPASSQVGFTIGLLEGGPLGALAAWTAFTLPSALADVCVCVWARIVFWEAGGGGLARVGVGGCGGGGAGGVGNDADAGARPG